ncbi:hypothetical protein M378DRAFT_167550 [Amanita muscaria Koide BX008]|uniref:Uncharacterized protein n=1 Tax=Amanita muscaria (strain Koide BX008) TaxID=946122 RepID=A0A0C2WVQ7_AMAMK|nr:hypothetical protein M378DRAFT_167550 [Amanita muscaria Koide BX008]
MFVATSRPFSDSDASNARLRLPSQDLELLPSDPSPPAEDMVNDGNLARTRRPPVLGYTMAGDRLSTGVRLIDR